MEYLCFSSPTNTLQFMTVPYSRAISAKCKSACKFGRLNNFSYLEVVDRCRPRLFLCLAGACTAPPDHRSPSPSPSSSPSPSRTIYSISSSGPRDWALPITANGSGSMLGTGLASESGLRLPSWVSCAHLISIWKQSRLLTIWS